jgi:kinetochore protein Spc24
LNLSDFAYALLNYQKNDREGAAYNKRRVGLGWVGVAWQRGAAANSKTKSQSRHRHIDFHLHPNLQQHIQKLHRLETTIHTNSFQVIRATQDRKSRKQKRKTTNIFPPATMLLDEDVSSIIAECVANFNIAGDKASLKRTTSALTHLTSARSQILTKHRSALSGLARHLSGAASTHALTVQAHNPAAHAQEMLKLDTHKFRIAKEAGEVEREGERLESEVDGARRALAEMGSDEDGDEDGGALGRESVDDETLLKLKVYRMLGIDVEPDAETGLYNKAVVRNASRGDVHVVNIDPKFSRYFYADYFWGTL